MTLTATLKATTAAVLLVSAIGTAANADTTHSETGEPLALEQTFTYRIGGESTSLDPGLARDVAGAAHVRDMFEGLMNQDADGTLIPGVATGYEVSDDGLVYTFTLRDNAKWSNGDPVTAGDFEYAWKRAASPELASPFAWYLELMAIANFGAVNAGQAELDALGVAATDDLTLKVTLAQPLSYFPQMVVHTTTFPVHQATVEAHGTDWTKPENIVSNGAYVLSEHIPNEKLVRVRNAQYWDNENTIIEEVTALVIADENIALARYLAGELDQTQVPAGQFRRLSAEYPAEVVSVPSACSYYYTINVTESGAAPLQDKQVRQALSMAIDRDIIVSNVLAGGQKAADTFTHWATAGFELPDVPNAAMTQAERNAKAAALMTAAGYGADNPLELDIIFNPSDSHKSVAIAISQMWKQTLGVETELASQEWQTFLETGGNKDFQIAGTGWCADYNEASTFLDLMQTGSSYNNAGYSSTDVDALLAEAKTSATSQAAYAEVEQIIAEDMPIIPIYHFADVSMQNDQLGGWPVNNLQQNWYSKDLYKIAE